MSLSRLCQRIEDISIRWIITFGMLWTIGLGIAAANHFPMKVRVILGGWIVIPYAVLIIAAHINNVLTRRNDGRAR